MSFPPKYFEILNKLDQAAVGKVSLDDQNWVDLPQPPAPTGIDKFPSAPEACIVATKSLPNRQVGSLLYGNQSISVIGYYQRLLYGTVTPGMALKETISVTQGASSTESFSATLGVSMGISIEGLADLSTTMSTTFGQSITLSQSETISHEFTISSNSGELSGVWWQAIYEYHFSAFIWGMPMSATTELPKTMIGLPLLGSISQTFYNNDPGFLATQFPLP
jgi:hypothetical protein